jgi:hypothetical protein
LFIDASGNVGVKASPTTRALYVNGAAGFGNGTIETIVSFSDRGIVGTASNHDLELRTNNTERLRITSDGKLGLGTSSPAEVLDVSGNIAFGASFAGRIFTKNAGGGNAAGTVEISAPNETTTRGVSFGNNYYITASNTYAQTATNIGGSAIEFRANNVNYGEILFRQKQDPDAGGAERIPMFISTAGNVGIGTTNPAQKLDVNGNIVLSGTGFLGFGGGVNYIEGDSGSNVVKFGTNNAERARIDSSGRLLVGASDAASTSKLQVFSGASGRSVFRHDSGDGGVTITGSGPGSGASLVFGNNWDTENGANFSEEYRIFLNPAGDALEFKYNNNASTAMVLDSSGKVGIGSQTPQSLLEVNATGVGSVVIPLTVANQDTSGSGTGAGIGFVIDGVNDVVGAQIEGIRTGPAYHQSAFAVRTRDANGGGLLERARIDGSGRVGIGTTSPSDLLHINNSSSTAVVRISGGSSATAYSVLDLYGGTTKNANIYANSDAFGLNASNSNPIRFDLNGSEKMRLDTSGRLLIGTSTELAGGSSTTFLQVAGGTGGSLAISRSGATTNAGDTIGEIAFFDNASGNDKCAAILCAGDLDHASGDKPSRLVFSTTADGASSPTERMRIGNKGNVTITSVADNDAALRVDSNGTSGAQYGIYIETGNDQNDAIRTFIGCVGGATTRAQIRSNGGIANYSANDVNLSDRNVKKNIAPAADTWNCLKDWEIVNFHYKDQTDDADLNMGVIAQQVAENCPEVVTVFQEAKEATETEPAQEERIGVKEQQMMWMAIKALQEAQIRIETLEAEVAALKAS